jgi:uncharacterized RDD family membrane protein YckC
MENNPYSAPNAPLQDFEPREQQLADRLMRLVAAIIDGLILMVVLIPVMFMGGYFTQIMSGVQPGFGTQLLWALIGFGLFVLIQGMPLAASGQTWAKKWLKMKIVDLQGNKPPFPKLIAARYLSTQLISLIPIVGALYVLVDCLFIFGEERRCVHDLIAGTRVVVAD